MPSALSSMLTAFPAISIASSFLLALALVPLLRSLSLRTARFAEVIPPVGGAAFLMSLGGSLWLAPVVPPLSWIIGGVGVGLVGGWDDLRARSPRGKTVLLLVVISVSVWLGEGRGWTGSPLVDGVLHVLWLLWMCNAFNVLDAVDGLTGGVGAILLGSFAFVLAALGLHGLSSVCGSLAACLVAYLVYNFHPARVYMGDTGSLLIGFVLGEAALQVASAIGGLGGVTTAALLVAVPCFEGVFLILIRLAKVTMPSQSTYDHPTQRLIQAGSSVEGAVIRMYVLTTALVAGAMVCWKGSESMSLLSWVVGLAGLVITGIRLAAVDTAGDGVDGRPGSVFSKNWLVHRILHKRMRSIAGRAQGILVDLGCGHRPYEPLFSNSVERYIGFDLNPDRYGPGEVDVVSDSAALPLAADSVDTVLSNQVLEHVREPGNAVDEMARILKPGGLAIITAPHIWGVHEEPHDYFRFTPFGLRHLAERSGLRVESVEALAGFWVTAGARFCYYIERFDRGPLRPVIALLNYTVQTCAFVLDHLHRVEGDAWNHMMIAVKPPGSDRRAQPGTARS